MENSHNDDGSEADGSHWVSLYLKKYPNGKVAPVYFDSFGSPPPTEVETFVGMKVPYNTKDIQSIVENFCGFAALAFLYYISVYEERTKDVYVDCEDFTNLFFDLAISSDFKHNENVLKQFFQKKYEDKISNKDE